MFYDIYCELCESKEATPSGTAVAIGFNRATVTTWKNTGKAPKGELLLKIAGYFDVPIDFLLQRPPFDHWDLINKDRRSFLAAIDLDPELLRVIWGIDIFDPYATELKDFISFINVTLLSAIPKTDGGWDIKFRAEYSKKSPAPQMEDGPKAKAHKLIDQIPEDKLRDVMSYMEFLRSKPDTE